MNGPPAARPAPQPSLRRDEKKGRALGGAKCVRVIGEFGIVNICDELRARRVYGSAPNAELVFSHRGTLVAIWLRSVGDDRGHLGERHGRSTITTERVRNDAGGLIGQDRILKHKDGLPDATGRWGQPKAEI